MSRVFPVNIPAGAKKRLFRLKIFELFASMSSGKSESFVGGPRGLDCRISDLEAHLKFVGFFPEK